MKQISKFVMWLQEHVKVPPPLHPWISGWENPYKLELAAQLHKVAGKKDHKGLGGRARGRYLPYMPKKALPSDQRMYIVEASNTPRTLDSAKYFEKGLFENDPIAKPIILVGKSEKEDDIATPWKHCPAWDNAISSSSGLKKVTTTLSERKKPAIAKHIAQELGLPESVPFPVKFVDLVYSLCTYDRALENKRDEWCTLLREDDFKHIEYLKDMATYYVNGPGSAINKRAPCPFITLMEKTFRDAVLGIGPKFVLRFAHAETIAEITAAMKLYRDAPTEDRETRQFRASEKLSFSANMFFELWKLPTGENVVRVLMNEIPVTDLPQCQGQEYCPLETFLSAYKGLVNCNLLQVCALK